MKNRTNIVAFVLMACFVCGGAVQTNVFDGIAWLYDRKETWGVIKGAHQVDDLEKLKPRRVSIPSEIGNLKIWEIGAKAMKGQSWIGELYIPDEVNVVGESAFADCSSLTNVMMAGNGRRGVGGIMDRAFAGCTNLEMVAFAERLDRIVRRAFSGCSKLKDVVLPPWLRVMEGYAFEGCKSLESVQLVGIQIIGENPFAGCSHLRSLKIAPDNEYYVVDSQGVLRSKDGKLLISYPTVPEDETVVIPHGVVVVGDGAAEGLSYLRRVRLPSSLRVIGPSAFFESGLEEVVIPDGVVHVDAYAFADSPLRRVVIGKDVEAIGRDCFAFCPQLEEIHFRGNKPEYDGVEFAPSNCVLYVVRRKGWNGVTTFYGNTVLDEPGQCGIDCWDILYLSVGMLGTCVFAFVVVRTVRHNRIAMN